MLLEPEQEQLLGALIEGSRQTADRSERVFDLIILDQVTFVSGPGLGQNGLPVEDDDVPLLEGAGFVRVLSRGKNMVRFRVTPEGQAHHEARTGQPGAQPTAEAKEADPGEKDPTARAGNLAAYRKSSDLPSGG